MILMGAVLLYCPPPKKGWGTHPHSSLLVSFRCPLYISHLMLTSVLNSFPINGIILIIIIIINLHVEGNHLLGARMGLARTTARLRQHWPSPLPTNRGGNELQDEARHAAVVVGAHYDSSL